MRWILTALCALALACGDDGTVTPVDAGPGDAAVTTDAALPADAGPPSALQMKADAIADALGPWQRAGWYDTVMIGVLEGDEEAYASLGVLEDGPPTADTPYEIGSVTKLFTGLLLQDAIARDEVMLTTPLGDLLPDATVPTGPTGGIIQLQHLATHTSGLPTFPGDVLRLEDVATYTEERAFTWLAGFTLPRTPGAELEYSNMGVGLLGLAIATEADSDLVPLYQTRLFDPFGLEATTFERPAETAPTLDHHLRPVDPIDLQDWLAGAGELRSTASDLLRFGRLNMHPESLPAPLDEAAPASHEVLYDREATVGSNWFIDEDEGLLWHNGATIGSHAHFAILPAEDRALVVLANVRAHVNVNRHFVVALDILRELEPVLRDPPDDFAYEPAVLDDYVGTYDMDGTPLYVTRVEDDLYLQLEGQSRYGVFARAEDEFYLRVVDGDITFERDGSGAVTAAIVRQGFGTIEAPRTE